MNEIKNKVIKTELVDWKKCKWLQVKGFKTLMQDDFDHLCASIRNNHVIDALKVWEDKNGDIYWLDGHHRQRVFEELEKQGYAIPEKIVANFIQCKNKREATKYCIIYGSAYARVTDQGLYEMIEQNKLDFQELVGEISIPDIDTDYFNSCYYGNNDLEIIEDENIGKSNLDHFYSGSSTVFRIGDFICYITEEGLRKKINEFVGKILAIDKDQRYINEVGTEILKEILKHEDIYTSKRKQ